MLTRLLVKTIFMVFLIITSCHEESLTLNLKIITIPRPDYVPDARDLDSTKYNYFYSFARLTQQDWYAQLIATNLLRACKSNNLDCYIVARKVWKETHFQNFQYSYLPERITSNGNIVIVTNKCAYSIMQINLKMWKKKLWDYKNGAVRSKLNNWEDYEREIMTLSVSIDVGTSIFRDYLDMFDDNIAYALCAYYGGENSSYLKELKKGIGNDYVTWIMDENKALGQMSMYDFVNPETGATNKWKYVRKW